MLVRPVKINDIADFAAVLARWDTGPYKVAAFFHEIVLMNYGAVRLEQDYLTKAYALCREHDVPVVADEIQSCIWSPEFFLFREYGLRPDVVSVGKGCPGGEYPAARILCSSGAWTPSRSSARWSPTGRRRSRPSRSSSPWPSRAPTAATSTRPASTTRRASRTCAARHPGVIEKMEGRRHLASLFFRDTDKLTRFVGALTQGGHRHQRPELQGQVPALAA